MKNTEDVEIEEKGEQETERPPTVQERKRASEREGLREF